MQQAARIAAAGHGGQVLVSAPTAGLLHNALPTETALADRGQYLLKDFDEPQALYQLTHPDLDASFPPLRAAPAIPHNLPEVRTSFVGRHEDLATLAELVAASRLVTVAGPGGAGKTRLGLELAARLAPGFEAGAQLSDLSPLADPALVEPTIASVYGVRGAVGADLMASVGRELVGRAALLVLDNCEHVVAAAAVAVERLLAAAPRLRVLATSREPLGVEGEQLCRIRPLDVPGPDASTDVAEQAESVRLFVDRARLAQPAFTLDEHDVAAVATICRRLEGLPLAIELTAARVATMSATTIATRLDELTASAASGRRRNERHRSLDATIDWSYQLLNSEQRRLLRSLSVFAGGFTWEAVEAVAGTERPLDDLASLVAKSLVVYAADADRYHLLETIRAFALSRLRQAGEMDSVAHRHLRWCAALAETVYDSTEAREAQAFATAEQEIGNIRAAATWAEEHAELDGLRLVGRLFWYWYLRAPVEGRSWADRMLATVPGTEPVAMGMTLTVQSYCAWAMGDVSAALAASAAALTVLRDAGNETALLYAIISRAIAAASLRDRTETRALYLEASELAARTGHTVVAAAVLSNLSTIERDEGNYKASIECAERGLNRTRSEEVAASIHALLRVNLGRSKLRFGAPEEPVHPTFVEAFDWATRTRAPMVVALALESLAETVTAADPDAGARLLGAAAGVLRTQGLMLDGQTRHIMMSYCGRSKAGWASADQAAHGATVRHLPRPGHALSAAPSHSEGAPEKGVAALLFMSEFR